MFTINKYLIKNIFITVFFLLCIHSSLHSQIIQGTITNPLTGKGIPGLVVAIGDSSAISDSLGHYVINLSLPTSVVENSFTEKDNLPREFCLEQNYPNPFNPTTMLRFGLPKRSITKLIVYDILGREVSTLVNQELETGYHEIKFDASSLSSGIYLYKIQAEYFSQTKKMIYLK